MTPAELRRDRYQKEWYDLVTDLEAVRPYHAENIKNCLAAIKHRNKQDRPIEVLVVHGSGRSSFRSCAHEISNSQMLLETGLEPFQGNGNVNITRVRLREYNIEPCNGCYSTASTLCGFPCDCFPLDPMQDLYPLVLKCDVMLCSTGVNQSAMSTRLKTFCDRLISLDGGFFRPVDQFQWKNAEFRDKCIELGLGLEWSGAMPYDARMWGRVAAYFITSKDENNMHEDVMSRTWRPSLSYIENVAHSLRGGFQDYGFFHTDPWYVGAAANPDEELSHDKQHYYERAGYHEQARRVVEAAIDYANHLHQNPPQFDGGARVNRT